MRHSRPRIYTKQEAHGATQIRILVKPDPKAITPVKTKSRKMGVEVKPHQAVVRIKSAKLEDALKVESSLGADIFRGVVFMRNGFMAESQRKDWQKQVASLRM